MIRPQTSKATPYKPGVCMPNGPLKLRQNQPVLAGPQPTRGAVANSGKRGLDQERTSGETRQGYTSKVYLPPPAA